ncbi:UPF0600 protein C5orf51 homolog [Salmo trutta]|uniref:UPF0600 protein C5orf51 homolog n=1 Tax=Salmo trutta TaxID=8032 RepID=UPI001130B526|nr:UPF0600 protein C5orf51 homolog [Salmo trutta]
MYCHTLHQRKQWIKKNKAIFLKCLQEGICYLMRMLHVRNSVKLNDGVVFHNSATANFLAEGIFSDTHMLMMMYIGEMCFWAVKYEDCSVDIGTQILHKYVLVCDAPLQGQGWNTENAKEILSILQGTKEGYGCKFPLGTDLGSDDQTPNCNAALREEEWISA